MKIRAGSTLLAFALLTPFSYGQLPLKSDPDFKVEPKTKISAFPFPSKDVRLLEGPFLNAVKANGRYLLLLEPDRLLHNYRAFSGLEPKGDVYGGWEQDTIAGHTLGHYLTACSLMYAQTGDTRFRERVAYIVAELKECQDADRDGYIAGFPRGREVFTEIKRGEIRSKGFDLNGLWVPLYNWHKLLSGLIDAKRLCQVAEAIPIAVRLTDFIDDVFSSLSDEQVQKVLACEHGGINESIANLYALTGETKYLELSKRIHHKEVLDPLADQRDILAGYHANTQIPKVIGVARLFELTSENRFERIAQFFWNTVTENHSYVIGGNSDREYFQAPRSISKHITEQTSESCNTYNMLKLTRHLFSWTADSRFADYYERALYNHILAHQNPETGMVAYMMPLRTGSTRRYSTEFDSFWCCVGTGIENHSKYGDSIFFHDGENRLFLNLFIPAVLNWREKNLQITQVTRFPFDDQVSIELHAEKPTLLKILVRRPSWLGDQPQFAVNGERVEHSVTKDGYCAIERVWHDKDVLRFTLPMKLQLEPTPDNANKVALLYGPVVIAGDLGPSQEEVEPPFPALVAEDILSRIELIDRENLTFSTSGLVQPDDLHLKPFFDLHNRRYAVYWDRYTPDQWKTHRLEYESEQQQKRETELRSVDIIHLGEMQPERDHNLQSDISWPSSYRGEKCRDARSGGFFSFEARVLPDQPVNLVARYWGGERNRKFDILVESEKIATQTLDGEHPGEFIERSYPIPERLTRDKQRVTILFQPARDRTAGPVFGCRIEKR